jgi:hypothetical protein
MFAMDTWNYLPFFAQTATAFIPSAGYNEPHFHNATFDNLYTEGQRTLDAAKRADIVHEMQQIFWDECPYIIPNFPPLIDALSKKVQGDVPSKTGNPFNNFDFKNMWFGQEDTTRGANAVGLAFLEDLTSIWQAKLRGSCRRRSRLAEFDVLSNDDVETVVNLEEGRGVIVAQGSKRVLRPQVEAKPSLCDVTSAHRPRLWGGGSGPVAHSGRDHPVAQYGEGRSKLPREQATLEHPQRDRRLVLRLRPASHPALSTHAGYTRRRRTAAISDAFTCGIVPIRCLPTDRATDCWT